MQVKHSVFSEITQKHRDVLKKLQMPLLFVCLMTFLLVLVFCILGDKYVFGSYIDWNSQHGVIPDYFRQKFYETGSLTGSFALELGGGVNPYALAYHGMLNPVLLPSYLFPGLHMYDYLIISSMVLLFVSLVLMYLWLRGLSFSKPISYFASVMLAFSAPFLFHFHKQLMFVDYLPFLLLAFMGIDRMLLRGKKTMFVFSFALALLTSFFFAVTLVITVTVYFFYRYLQLYKKITVHPVKAIGGFILSGIASCLMSCAVLLPAFAANVSGRETNTHTVVPSLIKMFLPDFNFSKLLYDEYGVGLTVIVLFALFALFFYKKAHTTFLSMSLLIIWMFPVCSFAMNAFLYDRGKAYIALLPLFLLVICLFIQDGSSLNISAAAWISCALALVLAAALFDRRYLQEIIIESVLFFVVLLIWKKKKTPVPLCISTVALLLAVCVTCNNSSNGQYLKKSTYDDFVDRTKEDLIATYAESEGLTRMADLTGYWYTCNETYGKNVLRSSIYSSCSNQEYLHLLHQTLCLTNPTPHKIVVADINNQFLSLLMGQEWLIDGNNPQMYGYEAVANKNDIYLYRNTNVYSLGFATDRLMSVSEFDALSPHDKQFALTGYVVVDDDSLPDVYSSPFIKLDVDDQIPLERSADGWLISSENHVNFSIMPNDGENMIYALRVNIEQMKDYNIHVTVNGNKNTFSGNTASFPNDNNDLWYIISNGVKSLDFDFTAGNYTVSAIELYSMEAEKLDQNRRYITMADELQYDGENTVVAQIHADTEGKFLFTIPADQGFRLLVDGEETAVEVLDKAFVGCSLPSGDHEITLIYDPPLEAVGIMLSVVGVGMTLVLFVWDNFRNKRRKV